MLLPPLFLRHCRYSDGIQADIFAKVKDLTKRHETQQSSPKPSKWWVGGQERGPKMAHLGSQIHKISNFKPCALPGNILLLVTGMAPRRQKNEFQAFFGKRKPKLDPMGASNSRKNDVQSLSNQFSKTSPMQNAQNAEKGKRTNSLTNPRSRDALCRQNARGRFFGTQPR